MGLRKRVRSVSGPRPETGTSLMSVELEKKSFFREDVKAASGHFFTKLFFSETCSLKAALDFDLKLSLKKIRFIATIVRAIYCDSITVHN